MEHINDNRLAAVAIRTTGPCPIVHQVIEIAVVPLNGTALNKDVLPFHSRVKLRRVDPIIQNRIAQSEIAEYRSAPYETTVTEAFENWYMKLKLPMSKRLIPVGYKIPHLYGHLFDLFSYGPKGELFLEDFFDFGQARCLDSYTHYWNDIAWAQDEYYPFNKHQPTYAAFRLGHLYEPKRTVLQEALMYAEIYSRMVWRVRSLGLPLKVEYPVDYDYTAYEEQEESDEPE